MKKCKVFLYAGVLLVFLFCLSGCGSSASVTEISLGDDLPVWMLDGEHSVEALPDNAEEEGLIGVYTTDTDKADVYVYSFPKEDGISLEDFGQQKAAERSIFCNMMTDRGTPAAVLNYYDSIGDEHYIVQAYIYESEKAFVEVCTMFKTEVVSAGTDDLSVRLIREYEGQPQSDSPLEFDTVYATENDRLPQLRIRKLSGNDFPADVVEPDLLTAVSDEEYAALAADGWTPDEIVSLYDECYDLLKGEVMCRNDLDLAFVGFVDEGIFKTRAVIVDGDDYLMLSAEAEASKFQHVTNALIDAIDKN